MVLRGPDGRSERPGLLDDDPLLRLYCVVASAASAHRELGTLPVARNAVGLGDLASSGFPGDVLSLKRLVEGRPTDWGAPDHLAEFVVRPLLITFRGLLARGCLPVGDIGVELDSESAATGRIVLAGICSARSAVPGVADVIVALDAQLDELAAACTLVTGDERVRAAFDAVIAQELRNLSEGTAAAFAGEHPWRRFVHAVAAEQHEILSRVVRLVRERSVRCRREPGLPRPLVAVDLDFCALHPKHRVRDALRRLGEAHGIQELAAQLDVLPGLYQPGWRPFLVRSGLLERYPELDWDALYPEYRRNVAWDWEALRTDGPAPGLIGFVRDLEQAGGRVVWLTGRRHRMRAATGEVLARHGLGHLELRTTDDGPVADQKVAALHEMPGYELVAAFDDSAANRRALQAAFPAAVVVAVRPPEFTVDGAGRTVDGIATFESLPHPIPLGRGHRQNAQLSHVTSLGGLRIGDLSTRPTIWSRGVELAEEEQARIVASLADAALASGQRLGGQVGAGMDPGPVGIARAVWQVITAKPFGAARSAYPLAAAERDVLASVEAGDRIRFIMVGPSLKQDGSRLKALGGLPDLSELAMLVRLRELDAAVRQVHPPGIEVLALTDASHFRFREPHRYAGYHEQFVQQVELAGAQGVVTVEDFDSAADAHPLCGDRAQRPGLLAKHRDRYTAAFAGLDIRRNPRSVLAAADDRDPAGPGQPRFVELFHSVLQAVDVPFPGGDPFAWSQRIYADPFDLTDPTSPPGIRRARGDLLALTWRETITYLANKHVDEELDYSVLWRENCVRLSLSIRPAPGRLRFVPLGGSGVIPWHGTATLNAQHEVSVDYAISLADQGFRPVHAPGTGDRRQPWFMAPPQALTRTGVLDPEIFERIRLRSK
ncbi:HAD family hydrolase [Saccharopolyspora spinosa]|uniref:HAD family hydrolase n=1 Tax=Saccharopolyspora spinosa TaxID=60894 RepID=UPI000C6F181F|nr:HAD family hydrolase [Saccharopolyspora spinosa]